MGADERLDELGIQLPPETPPVGNYVPAVRSGSLLFLAGHGPVGADGTWVTGKVGTDLDLDDARRAARLVALNLLATLRRELGSLDAVRRVVKVLGMVNCSPGFNQMPAVVGGCSHPMCVVLCGQNPRHGHPARAIGQ